MAAILNISPSSWSYGTVNTDSTNDKIFTVTNDGTDALTVSSITGVASPYSIQSDTVTGNPISELDSSTFVLRYIPTIGGVYDFTMALNSNDSSSPFNVPIDATAVQPIISASPTSIAFGTVITDSTTDATVTITNVGYSSLIVNDIRINDPLWAVNDNVTDNGISHGDSSTFVVRWIPHSAGALSSSVGLYSNDNTQFPYDIYPITGNAIDAYITVVLSPTVAEFGSVEVNATSTVTLTVLNNGDVPLVMGTLTGLASPFSLVSDNVSGHTIAPSASATVGIKFSPTTVGEVYDQLLLPSNDDESPALLGVRGLGNTLGRELVNDTGHRRYSGRRFEMNDMLA